MSLPYIRSASAAVLRRQYDRSMTAPQLHSNPAPTSGGGHVILGRPYGKLAV